VIVAVVVGLLVAVAAFLGGWLFDRVLFSEAKSGDGWRLVGTSPAEVDEPTLAVSLDQGELALSFSVYSGTGGDRECRQPTVILDGLDRRPDRVVARTQYRERGCKGDWELFTVAVKDAAAEPFVFEWNAFAEGQCTRYRVDGASVEPLEPASKCGEA
jgi:hypothetical protein